VESGDLICDDSAAFAGIYSAWRAFEILRDFSHAARAELPTLKY
jgi:hypothetical protein